LSGNKPQGFFFLNRKKNPKEPKNKIVNRTTLRNPKLSKTYLRCYQTIIPKVSLTSEEITQIKKHGRKKKLHNMDKKERGWV
jgi:hypothetical protein